MTAIICMVCIELLDLFPQIYKEIIDGFKSAFVPWTLQGKELIYFEIINIAFSSTHFIYQITENCSSAFRSDGTKVSNFSFSDVSSDSSLLRTAASESPSTSNGEGHLKVDTAANKSQGSLTDDEQLGGTAFVQSRRDSGVGSSLSRSPR